ncbi:MAG: hypothetical protein K1X28_01255 [Parachlamydiales bacterium]|nr:hypothetical protein [Parachlamydiales bacterium]
MKWAIFTLFFSCSLFSTDQLSVDREDGSNLIVYFDKADKESFPILFLIPGSQKESSLRLHESLRHEIISQGICPISLEKRGVAPDSIDEKEFLQHLTIHDRVADHLLIQKKLKELVPGWNGKVVILGQGDGGRIGAQLAAQISSVEAIALIASGGGWNPMDETLFSFRSEMADDGFSPQYIHGFLVQARREFAAAKETPKADKKAFGYTYKYWESLLKTNLAHDLSLLKCPIYSFNGENDDRVPIESVEQLAQTLEDRMMLIRKEKAGREIIQDPKIYKEAISWLTENF